MARDRRMGQGIGSDGLGFFPLFQQGLQLVRQPFDAVGRQNFVGRAEVIFFSLDEGVEGWQVWKWPTAVRWSRLFQPVR